MSKKVIIVGSGIAGIASAIRMAVKGFQVEVFEANSYPGGKLSEIEIEGYRFDAGPSLFTLPEQVEELFRLAGKDPQDHFDYLKLPVACHYFWEDGTRIHAYADLDKFADEVESKLSASGNSIRKALEDSAFIYDHLSPLFMHR
jgi:phytoene dehydrogenase-like protein